MQRSSHDRNPQKAQLRRGVAVCDDALAACSELPEARIIFHYQVGWLHLLLCDWPAAAAAFRFLLYPNGDDVRAVVGNQ